MPPFRDVDDGSARHVDRQRRWIRLDFRLRVESIAHRQMKPSGVRNPRGLVQGDEISAERDDSPRVIKGHRADEHRLAHRQFDLFCLLLHWVFLNSPPAVATAYSWSVMLDAQRVMMRYVRRPRPKRSNW